MNFDKVLSDIDCFVEKRGLYFNVILQVGSKGVSNFLIIEISLDNEKEDEIIKYLSDFNESINKVGHEDDESFQSEVIKVTERNLSFREPSSYIQLKMRFSGPLPKIKVSKHGGGTKFTQTCYQSRILDLD